MTVRTNPPGAMVYVDKNPVGLSPVSANFTYYGTRNVEITRDGYRTERFLRKFDPPWYEIPPLDFFSESLWPFEQRDERIIDVQLTPEPIVPKQALIASGEQLRLQASQGVAVTPPPTIAPSMPIVTLPVQQFPPNVVPINPN
ncbi:MAG: PEGA domain-containing protein [Pirellula sp.]